MTHEAVPYSRRPYEHYDPAVMEQAMADFEQACAVEGRDEEVLSSTMPLWMSMTIWSP